MSIFLLVQLTQNGAEVFITSTLHFALASWASSITTMLTILQLKRRPRSTLHRSCPIGTHPPSDFRPRTAMSGLFIARWLWGKERGTLAGIGRGGLEEEIRRLVWKRRAATGGALLQTVMNPTIGTTMSGNTLGEALSTVVTTPELGSLTSPTTGQPGGCEPTDINAHSPPVHDGDTEIGREAPVRSCQGCRARCRCFHGMHGIRVGVLQTHQVTCTCHYFTVVPNPRLSHSDHHHHPLYLLMSPPKLRQTKGKNAPKPPNSVPKTAKKATKGTGQKSAKQKSKVSQLSIFHAYMHLLCDPVQAKGHNFRL